MIEKTTQQVAVINIASLVKMCPLLDPLLTKIKPNIREMAIGIIKFLISVKLSL